MTKNFGFTILFDDKDEDDDDEEEEESNEISK